MRVTARKITLIVFLAILVGCGLAILYLGTSTGLIFGGARTVTNTATESTPMFAQSGWLRNTSPWPITITKIRVNAVNAKTTPTVYLEGVQSRAKVTAGRTPTWVRAADPLPYRLIGGDLRYLGFGISPQADQVAAFRSITVSFVGPLGFTFSKTFGGTDVAAASSTLSDSVLAPNPAKDASSLDDYITLLRTAIVSTDASQLAAAVGGKPTAAQLAAFQKSQLGYVATDKISATRIDDLPSHVKLVFYKTDPTKDALAPMDVTWSNFRWTVDLPTTAQN
jgi:hypothetical protein